MTELNTKEYYAKQQKAFNAKIGDRVFIFQRCESHENGWNDTWCEYMNSSVGEYGIIKYIDEYFKDVIMKIIQDIKIIDEDE